MFSLILLELTLQNVLTDIPHDGGAMLTYSILLVFIGCIWAGSRPHGDSDSGSRQGGDR